MPTLTPIATPAQGYQVATLDRVYTYAIDTQEVWWEIEETYPGVGYYRNTFMKLFIRPVSLAGGTIMEQFAQSPLNGPLVDIREVRSDTLAWSSEVTSFERTRVGDQDVYSIAYRIADADGFFDYDVVEKVIVDSSLPGGPRGFRAASILPDSELRKFEELRELRSQILDSFRVVTRPPAYYTQSVFAHGITVKASSAVAPAALVKAAESVTRMMVGLRHDIRECLVIKAAPIVIYPRGRYLGDLPEFQGPDYENYTGGRVHHSGNIYATPESDLFRGRKAGAVTMHEFAHAIMNLCFTKEEKDEVTALYNEALRVNAFRGSYAMTNRDEFFAETSVAYFHMPPGDWGLAEYQSGQDALRRTLPQTFAFMERIYGEPPLR